MEKVYIKGVSGRGAEVIAKLESLGGHNSYKISGADENYLYFVTSEGNIDCVDNTAKYATLFKWVGEEIFLDEPKDNVPKSTDLKDIIKPVWDEEHHGVFIPIINKILCPYNLSDKKENWNYAIKLAENAEKTLPTKEDGYIIMHFKDEINTILLEHGGNILEGWIWLSQPFSIDYAWGMHIDHGNINDDIKYQKGYVRAISKFNVALKTQN